MLNKILDLIFPPKCAFCQEILTQKQPVCDKCMSSLTFTDEFSCECCHRPLDEYSYRLCSDCNNEKRYFERSFVPLVYDDIAKQAVLLLKHYSHPYYAKAFAFLIADNILSSDNYVSFDYITCIPSNNRSKLEKGYNQAELIARELSKLLKIPFTHTLIRTEDGERQATLDAVQRKLNVKKCYFPGKKTFNGETVLLVDDVYTTGETANHCSKLLRKIGFSKIYLGIATIRGND